MVVRSSYGCLDPCGKGYEHMTSKVLMAMAREEQGARKGVTNDA